MPSLSMVSFLEGIISTKIYGFFGIGKYLLDRGFYVYLAVIIAFGALSYFIGSLNFAVIISKAKFHDDIRNYGSKNAGFTNMKRIFGIKAALATIAGDMLKGIFCAGLALLLFGEEAAYVAGLGAILGHCYPIWYGFKGGKGVATLASVVLVLEPVIFIVLFLIFAVITLVSKYLSLGSIMVALLYPLMLNGFYNVFYGRIEIQIGSEDMRIYLTPIIYIVVLFLSLFVVFKHRSNIKRIWAGTENKFYLKSKSSHSSANPPAGECDASDSSENEKKSKK